MSLDNNSDSTLTYLLFSTHARRYINFGALCMNFLKVSKNYAELTDPDRADGYDAPISAIQSLMSVLTFGLLLSFAGVGIKKAYVAVQSTSLSDLHARARSLGRVPRVRMRHAAAAARLRSESLSASTRGRGEARPAPAASRRNSHVA